MFSGWVPASALTAVGLLGVVLYLAAYAALQLGFLRARGYAYPLLNLLAASCTLVALVGAFNLSSALIQVAWILISIAGIVRLYWISRSRLFASHELMLKDGKFAGLDSAHFRQFLNAGQWHEGKQGDVLTVEGEPVRALSYLLDVHARVTYRGTEVALCTPGSLVGEGGVLACEEASATVTLSGNGRYFSIDGKRLAALAGRNAEIGVYLRRLFSDDLRDKLRQSNSERSASFPPDPRRN